MVFSSILFLFVFMPFLLIYYVVPFKFKNFVIVVLSFVFYSWGEPKYFFVMLITILVNYLLGLILERYNYNRLVSKIIVNVAVVFNVGELFFFKYYDFFINNINSIFGSNLQILNLALPLGISFYIFQILSYILDVYKKRVVAEHNIVDFAAFVVLFPQLIAGPIVKYTDINKELKSRKITLEDVQSGIRLFIYGLGSKVLIANNIGLLWNDVQSIGFANISSVLAWLSILAFGLQIYFDFSGYSLMAIGLGKMLGFNFPQNFNYPYVSKSVTEFWRRWHMTLSFWFRDYLYIPLGGNRKGVFRTYLNLLIVWFVTGFWHGANWNFIFWGLFFYVFIVIEKLGLLNFLSKHKIISHVYLVFLILLSWSLFAIVNFDDLKIFVIKLFSFNFNCDWIYYLRNYFVILTVGVIFSTPFLRNFYNKFIKNYYFDLLVTMLILVLSVAYLVDATYNPFLYFRF